MSGEELEPLSPRDAMEMWIDRQRSEKASETVQSYFYRVRQFVEWCESEGIGNLNELSTRDVYSYDSECRAQGLAQSTLNNQLGTIKIFLSFCADLNAVRESIVTAVDVPSLVKDDRVNVEKLSTTRAEKVLELLSTYRHASREHALFALAWESTARLGALRSLDLGDCFLSDDDLDRLRHYPEIDDSEFEEIIREVESPFVYFRHREGTPLKNQYEGQRPVAISEDTASVLRGYISVNRVQTTDRDDRAPLFSSEKGSGRMSKSAIRRVFNIVTQPCRFGLDCPHGREIEECEAREHGLEARCPSSRSP